MPNWYKPHLHTNNIKSEQKTISSKLSTLGTTP